MERREIEALLALADELSFTRTAERLHVSTAAVSQIVTRVERRVGTRLFTRTTRRVELTEAGRGLVEELRVAHEQIQAAVAHAVDAGRRIATRLRIGYMSVAVGHEVLRLVDAFQRFHPDCEVSITETSLTDLFGPVRRAEVDLCVLPLPVDEHDLTVGPVVMTERALVAVPSSHHLAGRRAVSPQNLRDETVLSVRHLPPYWVQHHLAVSTPRPTTADAVSSPDSPDVTGFQELLTLVAAGRGVAVVGEQAAAYYPRPGLAFLPCPGLPPFRYALTWRTTAQDATTAAFARHAARSAQPG